MILLGTDTPDYLTPATSTVVQYKLGVIQRRHVRRRLRLRFVPHWGGQRGRDCWPRTLG